MSHARLHTCETVATDASGRAMLDRYRVAGGWIYAIYREPGSYDYAGQSFVPDPPDESHAAPHHVCDHGFAAMTCAICTGRDGPWPR